jgi:hypothetical protein
LKGAAGCVKQCFKPLVQQDVLLLLLLMLLCSLSVLLLSRTGLLGCALGAIAAVRHFHAVRCQLLGVGSTMLHQRNGLDTRCLGTACQSIAEAYPNALLQPSTSMQMCAGACVAADDVGCERMHTSYY